MSCLQNQNCGKSFAEYNQQVETFLNLFMSVRRSTCFRQGFRPSSGAQNCTHGVRYWSDPARKLSANLYDIYHCFVYSEKLLMMDRGTVQNT